jgi:hypothetical protein
VEKEQGQRQARLRAEFAAQYPYLTPGVWESTAVLADRVVANILGLPNTRFISRERALDPAHFEFRSTRGRPLDRRRLRLEDTAPE